MEHRKIAFIGAGNMAKAIIAGLISSDYPANAITATAPGNQRLIPLADTYGINTSNDNQVAAEQAEVIILSVKPQLLETVCEQLKSVDLADKLLISVAAGVNCNRISEMLKQPELNLIRVMPNTPSLINRGMSGLFATCQVSANDKTFATQLFQATGEICWVQHEAQINAIIAAAGSAPAYFFLFMEAIQKEAMAQGFDQDTARLLVQQTAIGAAEMVKVNSDTELSVLREQVTSKGGTTAEAIRTFNEHHLSEIVAKAMQAAVSRAEEMEKLF
ncbi:Pyrroline-5-carboxylate reductase [Vibrio aerogenes CECT 7868]|uniref:Pyrroline-5-carboxylate reductase n=1 Tax=Vibrio aerogenes CECT 7868 TaxID=1216006 RepID=A0A1M5YJ89_9VIBR|nr:pyrroline-5-carboxylate reductase [Vibrio aerogenes]SHI12090.1 Pyrroline-5-carboxylate reductase [Vibrio aerogenes CECT 7868]